MNVMNSAAPGPEGFVCTGVCSFKTRTRLAGKSCSAGAAASEAAAPSALSFTLTEQAANLTELIAKYRLDDQATPASRPRRHRIYHSPLPESLDDFPDRMLPSRPPTIAPPTRSATSVPRSSLEPFWLGRSSSCSIRETTQSNLPLVTAALQYLHSPICVSDTGAPQLGQVLSRVPGL